MKNKITETPQLSLWAWRIVVNHFDEKLSDLRRSHTYYENKEDEKNVKEIECKIRETEMVINELYGYNPEEA